MLREKQFVFKKAKLNNLIDQLVTDDVVIYAHLPTSPGKYGSGFVWNYKIAQYTLRVFQSFHESGHKILISMRGFERGHFNFCHNPFLDSLKCDMIPISDLSQEYFYSNF